MKIKILHCITDLSPDGAQRALLRLVQSMDRERFENQVVSLLPNGSLLPQLAAAGIEVRCLDIRRFGPLSLLSLARMVRSSRPDIIQGWMYHGNLVATLGGLLSMRSATLLWNIRRCLYNPAGDKKLTSMIVRLGAPLSRIARKVIYCVSLSADQHEAIGYAVSKRVIIPNGFDTERFTPSASAALSLRATLGIAPDDFIVGIVGRYHPQKDFPTFFKAARLIVDRFPKVKFVLAGRGLESGNAELRLLIDEQQLENSVHLLGERQDMPAVMAGFDLFCSSSANEGFSNVVAEAMACGVPCVVTDAGASRELVEGIGLVVERSNPPGLAEAILAMVGLEGSELKRRGTVGRERIVANYSLRAMTDAYEQLYEEVALGRVRT